MEIAVPLILAPLLIVGIPMVLFGDRIMPHHSENVQNGKEYIWEQEFVPLLGELISEIDESSDLTDQLKEFEQITESSGGLAASKYDSKQHFLKDATENAPFTLTLRKITDSISKHSREISQLEDDYDSLQPNLRYCGMGLIVIWIIGVSHFLVTSFWMSDFWIHVSAIMVGVIILGISIENGRRFLKRKERLRRKAIEYERTREF